MSKLFSLIRRAPKTALFAVGVIAAAVIVPATLFAWGPSRDTYTMDEPADHVVFNSITDNPSYGDERNFVTIKPVENRDSEPWTDDITVENGKYYYVRMYVHNNAAANLNESGIGVAKDVTAKFNIPDYYAKRIQIDGYLKSSNAEPSEVWDQAVFSSNQNFKLEYVQGSATYTNNVHTGGTSLPNTVSSTGAKLGYESMNGIVPGCMQYTGLVIFRVKATTTQFEFQKTVRVSGQTGTPFYESVSANPGDKVDFQIYFKNTGGVQLKDVVIKDKLPTGLTYVSGTTYLKNSDGTKQVGDGITAGGANIGGYLPEGDAYIKFTAQIAANDSLPTCGLNTLTNTATITTEYGSADDPASVSVTKKCSTPTPTPVPSSGNTSLPQTGAAEDIFSFLGLGTMVTTACYYIASRRSGIIR